MIYYFGFNFVIKKFYLMIFGCEEVDFLDDDIVMIDLDNKYVV